MEESQVITEYFRRNRQPLRDSATGKILKDEKGKIRKIGGKKVGVMAAAKNPVGNVMIGWSLAHRQLETNFDPHFGTELAIARTQAYTLVEPPLSMKPELTAFAERAKRYFKDCEVVEIK